MSLHQTLREMLCIFCIVCFTSIEVNSQVQLTIKPINSVNFSSQDIWNFDVLNSGTHSINVNFQGIIQNPNGLTLVKLVSTSVVIRPGVNSFNKIALNTLQLTYMNSDIGKYESVSSFLPPGNYNICVYLNCVEPMDECAKKLDLEQSIGDCNNVLVESPTPLLLSLPEDKAKLNEKRPNFIWIPPMPIGQNPDLKYEMTLVKMNNQQSAEDAIIRNRPIYKEGGLGQTIMAFPVSSGELEVGEKYAWTVKAFLGNIYIAQAEVWEFEIPLKKDELSFVNLSNPKQGTHNCSNVLNFNYTEKYIPCDLQYIIIDSKGKNVCEQCPLLKTITGNNSFSIDRSFGNMNKNELYTLVITNSKGKKIQLKFIYTE